MIVIRAVVPLLVIIVLFVFLGKIGFGKISEIRSQIASARHDQAVLTEKLDILRTVAVNGVQDSNIATNSLPDSNPTLLAMSQLKTLAAGSGLLLRSLKSSSVVTSEQQLNSVLLEFNITGTKSGIETFLSDIRTFSPISVLDSAKVTQSGDILMATITVRSFWAPFPSKLPSTIEEFSDLTPDEKETLANLSALTQPSFVTLPPPSESVKQDPFLTE